jgi:hypothetical protein
MLEKPEKVACGRELVYNSICQQVFISTRRAAMRSSVLNCLVRGAMVVSVGLMISACNTTKATVDTMVNFTQSTTPGALFTADGLVNEDQKVNLYTAVVHENLQQDIARGGGEYLTSLGVLMKVPEGRRDEFGLLSQRAYPALFVSDQATPSETLATLTREWRESSPVR